MKSVSQPISITNQSQSFQPKTGMDLGWVIIIGGSICIVLLLAISGLSGGNRKGKTATARWATHGEIERCRKMARKAIKNPRFNRAALYISEPVGGEPDAPGKTKAKVMIPQINRSILVVGGAGSGKTASAIDPMLLSAIAQGFSIILYDFKFGGGGQSEGLLPYAYKHGYNIRIFAPGKACTQTFNILELVKDDKDLAGAKQLVSVTADNTGEAGSKKDNFFDPAGASICAASFVAAKWIAKVEGDPDLGNILMANQILSLPNLAARLVANRDKIPAWIFSAFSIIASNYNPKNKSNAESGIMMTAQKILAPIVLPNYLPAFCGKSSFPHIDKDDPIKVDGKSLVIFGVDKDTRDNTIPIIATCIQQVVSRNLKPGRVSPAIISLDEFASMKLTSALDWIVQERYNGCSIMFGIQYREQLLAKYGKDWGEGFEANCATKFDFNPGSDTAASFLSKTLGEEEIELDSKSESVNSGGSGSGGRSRSTSKQLHRRPLKPAHEIAQMPAGNVIIRSPGVGTKQRVGIPFERQITYSETRDEAFKAKNKVRFAQIIDAIEQDRAPINNVDWSEEMARYNAILEKWLPLPGEAQVDGNAKTEPKDRLSGSKIIEIFARNNRDVSNIIVTDRIYKIPPEFMKDNVATFRCGDLPKIVEYNDDLN